MHQINIGVILLDVLLATMAQQWQCFIVQLCGARGGGQAAVRALYWVANKSLSLMLVLESERERNAAILLARRFARDQNVSVELLPLVQNFFHGCDWFVLRLRSHILI